MHDLPLRVVGYQSLKVSDGQRRRVQIMLNLLQPVDLMLLDEVTGCMGIGCMDMTTAMRKRIGDM